MIFKNKKIFKFQTTATSFATDRERTRGAGGGGYVREGINYFSVVQGMSICAHIVSSISLGGTGHCVSCQTGNKPRV